MPFELIRNDITKMKVDAIVNAANRSLLGGGGVDGAIHRAAGPELLEECRTLGGCETGDAKITKGYRLPARYVIHTVGPIWHGGGHGEKELLASCYRRSLELADKAGCESVAFPMISAGAYGYPKDQALSVAMETITGFLMDHEMMVYLVVFDKKAYGLSEKLFKDVESYIDDNLVEEMRQIEYGAGMPEYYRRMEAEERLLAPSILKSEALSNRKLEDLMEQVDETFSEALIRTIDEKGFKDPDVYKRANISKQHFYKIKNNKDYQPKKSTALAFAVALHLNLDETKDLIGKAGYLLSKSSRFDIIVQYFIERQNYNIFEINEVLFAFTDQILGS